MPSESNLKKILILFCFLENFCFKVLKMLEVIRLNICYTGKKTIFFFSFQSLAIQKYLAIENRGIF